MIYTYLPQQCIGKDVRDMEFDEFFQYYAMAEYARKLKIQDIEYGVAKGIVDAFGED